MTKHNFLIVNKSKNLTNIKDIVVPGDKSISHRALIFAALSIKPVKIYGLLQSEDVFKTYEALEQLGAKFKFEKNYLLCCGFGLGLADQPLREIYLGNSGTSARLLCGLIASHDITAMISGDRSLSSRPMARVIDPLHLMSANIESHNNNKLPIIIKGKGDLLPITYRLPVASAQVKSAIILAALNTLGTTVIIDKFNTRDHTEIMLKQFNATYNIRTDSDNSKVISVFGKKELQTNTDVIIPADISSASFLIIATLITKGSKIKLKNIGINPTRSGLLEALKKMGANIKIKPIENINGEELADIEVAYSKLNSISLSGKDASTMIDEYPILFVAAAFACGESLFLGLEELRHKESDRIAAMEKGLKAAGIDVEVGPDFVKIKGLEEVAGGNIVDPKLDHRIAMSFCILGLASNNPITVKNPKVINTSYPNFIETLKDLSANIKLSD